MNISHEINPETLDNHKLFNNEFYNRFSLNPYTLQLNKNIAKTYMFPTFYGNVTQSVAIYLCSYKKAAELLPHKNLKPVSMGGGRTLVIFSCYEYKNVHQIDSYNEIAMTIPVMADPRMNIPVIPMLLSNMFKKFGYYVFSMPVTSLENRIRGNEIWGLPKVTQEISFDQKDGYHICSAKEETGEPYFELKVPMAGKTVDFDESGYLYSHLNNSMLKSKTCFKGSYSLNKYMSRLFKKEASNESYLWLGDTPGGNLIKDLELDDHPFQFRYAENVSSCFDLPDESQAEFLKNCFSET